MELKWPSGAFTVSTGKKQYPGLSLQPSWGPRLYIKGGRRDSATGRRCYCHFLLEAAAVAWELWLASEGPVFELQLFCFCLETLVRFLNLHVLGKDIHRSHLIGLT